MNIILLRFLLLLLFALQTVKEDVCLENKIQLFVLLDYVKGVRFLRVSGQALNSHPIVVNTSAVLNCSLSLCTDSEITRNLQTTHY